MDGLGAVACCGKKECNLDMFSMFQAILKAHKLTMEVTRNRPEIVFVCGFCFTRSTVHRCSGCKNRWYCGEECQMKDWKIVHKEMSRADEEREEDQETQLRKEEETCLGDYGEIQEGI